MMNKLVLEQSMKELKASFGRCLANGDFFNTFYGLFLNSSPKIAEKFKNTDLAHQINMVRSSVNCMILFAKEPDVMRRNMASLAKRHSKQNLNISPDLYGFWLGSFLQAVRKHDSQCTDELISAWKNVLQPGIDFFVQQYE